MYDVKGQDCSLKQYHRVPPFRAKSEKRGLFSVPSNNQVIMLNQRIKPCTYMDRHTESTRNNFEKFQSNFLLQQKCLI